MKEKDFNELKEMVTEIVDECLNEIRKFGYCEVAGMEDYQKQVIAEVYGDTLYESFDGDFIALKEFFDEEDLDELKCYKPKQKEEQVFNIVLTKKEIGFVLHCMLTACNEFDKYFNLLDENDDDYAECEETSKEFEEIINKLSLTFNKEG